MPLPDPTPTHAQAVQTGNAILPTVLIFGSLVLGFFQPAALLVWPFALGWLALVLYRRRLQFTSQHDALAHSNRELIASTAHARLLEMILNASDIPMIVVEGKAILLANRAAEKIFGAERSLTNIQLDELFTHQGVLALAYRALDGESGRSRFQMPINGQNHDFDVACDPLADSQGSVFTFRDITELANAVALKADFASNASHELRTPIASIRGAIETIESAKDQNEPINERMITIIARNASRLEMLVNDLLDLSKLESPESPPNRETIGVPDLVGEVIEHLSAMCSRRSVTIKSILDPGLESISTDPGLIELIVRNLVENAAKFTKEGSVVEISFAPRSVTPDPESMVTRSSANPTGLRLSVKDRGIGIPLAEQQRVFERFYRVNDAQVSSSERGTGLGLAIVKHACRRLGGTISVNSVYGQGTEMIVDLPWCVGEQTDHADG